MTEETKVFFKTVGLEMNKDKSATNTKVCSEETRLLDKHEGYKYLGLTESAEGRSLEENVEVIMKEMERRVALLAGTKLNARNSIVAINQHALSLINYYIGILNIEPNKYKEFDDIVRSILIKYHIHHQPACKERLYLPRKELGRGLTNTEFKSERMLLQLYNTLDKSKETCLRRRAILYIENKNNSHMSRIALFLKAKYKTNTPPNLDELKVIQSKSLYSEISKKYNHAKLYRPNDDPNSSLEESSK